MAVVVLTGVLHPHHPQCHDVLAGKFLGQHLGAYLNPTPVIEQEELVDVGCGSPVAVQSRNLQPRKNNDYSQDQKRRDQ